MSEAEFQEQQDDTIDTWLVAEQWFMRYLGAATLLIALISVFSGILANPLNENIVTAFNGLMTILLFAGGVWAIWWSWNVTRMRRMVMNFAKQPPERALITAAVEIVIGILFVLEGLNGRLAFLLLGLVLFTAAGWAFWRRGKMQQVQASGLE